MEWESINDTSTKSGQYSLNIETTQSSTTSPITPLRRTNSTSNVITTPGQNRLKQFQALYKKEVSRKSLRSSPVKRQNETNWNFKSPNLISHSASPSSSTAPVTNNRRPIPTPTVSRGSSVQDRLKVDNLLKAHNGQQSTEGHSNGGLRKAIKRRGDPDYDGEDICGVVKRTKVDEMASLEPLNRSTMLQRKIATSKRFKPKVQTPVDDYLNSDIEMTVEKVQEEINSLRDSRMLGSRKDGYCLSISLSADNKLLIDYCNDEDAAGGESNKSNGKGKEDAVKLRLVDPQNALHIVVDTNVFLHDITLLDRLMARQLIKSTGLPILIIPYTVLEELDRLKGISGRQVCLMARKAIKYIHDKFRAKNEQLKGQSGPDQERHLIEIRAADDNILNCCLQIKNEKTKNVALLTNDMNLRNKAMVNQLTAFSSQDAEDDAFELSLLD